MPFAQSSELPPPRPTMTSTPSGSAKARPGFDHRAVGIRPKPLEQEHVDPGALEELCGRIGMCRPARRRRRQREVSGARRARAATRPETLERAGTEQDARERPEFERNHRAVDSIIRPPATLTCRDLRSKTAGLTGTEWLICGDRGYRIRVRYLRAADAAAHRRAGARRAHSREAWHSGIRRLGGSAFLRARRLRRRLRPARRIPHRSSRPAAGSDVEHPALRVLGARGRVRDEHLLAARLPVHDVRRRVRGVRRGDGLARGALLGSAAARARARLHAGLRVGGRRDGQLRLLSLR